MKTTKTAVEDKMLFIAAKLRCEVCLLKRKEERKHSAVEMNYLRRSARVSIIQKSQTPPLGAKCK